MYATQLTNRHSSLDTPSSQETILLTIMSSEITAVHASVRSGLSSSAEIKQEESDIEPLTPLVTISRLTPIPISTPTLIASTAATIPATIIHPSIPAFTPIATATTITTHTVVSSSNRKQGRQGRPPKERSLIKKQPAETVNYPCHEQIHLSEFHRQKLQELDVYPADGVGGYTRSIPFKGAKENFLKKSGRSRFDGMNVLSMFVFKSVLMTFAYVKCLNIDSPRLIQRVRISTGG